MTQFSLAGMESDGEGAEAAYNELRERSQSRPSKRQSSLKIRRGLAAQPTTICERSRLTLGRLRSLAIRLHPGEEEHCAVASLYRVNVDGGRDPAPQHLHAGTSAGRGKPGDVAAA